jgi:PAS domain S-box-containing protein
MTTQPVIDFKKLIESLPDATVIVNQDGKIVLVNAQAELLFGYPRQELLNQPLEILIPVRNRSGHIRERIGYYLSPHIRPMGKGLEIVGLRKDGHEFSADISLSPVEAGEEVLVISSIRDISDRKKIEEALTEEKERLSVTLRSIGDGVITVDSQGRIVFLNRVAEILTGWGQTEAKGRPLLEIFHLLNEKTRQPYEDPVAAVLSTGKIVEIAGPTLLISKEGIERSIVDCAAPIRDPGGKILGVVLVFRDITGKQKMEEELLRTMKLESIGLLAAGVAHDFNNLLTSILGNLDLVMTEKEPRNKRSHWLSQIEKAALRAKEIASQLLTFAKGATPVKRVVSIKELIAEAAGFALPDSNCRCELVFSDPLWPVEVDPGQIIQVIHNLLINASHAMPEGGVMTVGAENITLKNKEARHRSLKPGNYVRVFVKDSGVGISKEHLHKIFDPYFTTKETGTGLGLSNSYSIIKKHHGTISVDSQVGTGSTFSFYLPATTKEIPAPSRGEDALHIRHLRVLIFDDDPMIRETAGEILKQIGYEVVYASEEREAVELFRQAKESGEPFDAVILDLNLSNGMGGIDLLARLKAIDPSVRAIISGGNLEDPVMADCRKYGFKGKLAKPYDKKDLARVLHEVLSVF